MGKYSPLSVMEYADLILLIKSNSVIYMPRSEYRSLCAHKMTSYQYVKEVDAAWEYVSKRLNLKSIVCKRIWTNLKSSYLKLKELILSGKVSQQVIESHPITKFMRKDGILSFLDPYIHNGVHKYHAIPPSVHKYYDNLFHVNTLGQDPNNSSPAHENYDKEHKAIERHKLGLETELIIEDHIKTETEDEDVDIIESPSIEIIQLTCNDNEAEHILPHDPVVNISSGPPGNIIEPENNIQDVWVRIPATHVSDNNHFHMNIPDQDPNNSSPAGNIIVPDNIIDIPDVQVRIAASHVSDNEMIKFFEDLGNMASTELSIEKQKILRKRINALLVKEKILMS